MTGHDLIARGFEPGPWFKDALMVANHMEAGGAPLSAIIEAVKKMQPVEPPVIPTQRALSVQTHFNISPQNEDEFQNVEQVRHTMHELLRTPTIRAASVMPDACPAGPLGTIPVGGVVKAENAVHPGMHSADICCSVAMTILDRSVSLKRVLDAAMNDGTHFGGGRRSFNPVKPGARLLHRFSDNQFLQGLEDIAKMDMATQGDGNHFFYVGTLLSTGEAVIVTHHGSRRPGALLYKLGMNAAEKFRRKISPDTLKGNAWIPMDTQEGADYWEALQIIRQWTKQNHFGIHDTVMKELGVEASDRFWNEHNFVFERDGFYYHGKGATPAWQGFADDPDVHPEVLIPLNMAEPILIVRGNDAAHGLGFAPHGAGRNYSRAEHNRRTNDRTEDVVERETRGLDVRFWTGVPDTSELPSAYKSAESVRNQIEQYELATPVDMVMPYGTIMAGRRR